MTDKMYCIRNIKINIHHTIDFIEDIIPKVSPLFVKLRPYPGFQSIFKIKKTTKI